jgi:hypothetical protein
LSPLSDGKYEYDCMNIQMNPVITRVFYIYINVAIPILNPLVILLGNRQIRKKAIGLKKLQTSNKIKKRNFDLISSPMSFM